MEKTFTIARYCFIGSSNRLIILISAYALSLFLMLNIGRSLELLIQLLLNKGNIIPYTLVIPYYCCLFLIPVISLLLTYDSVSGHRSKDIRILFTRTDRDSFLMGKLIFAFVSVTALIIATFLPIIFYTHSRIGKWIWTETLIAMLFLILLGLVFQTIGIFISAVSSDQGSSARTSSLVLIMLIILLFTSMSFLSPFDYAILGLKTEGLSMTLRGIAMLLSYPFILSLASHLAIKGDE